MKQKLTPIQLFLVNLAIVISSIGSSHAEMWRPLEGYVSDCVLIVKAKTASVGPGNKVTFQVLESWKGKYKPTLLKNTTKDGHIITYKGEHGVDVVKGQEIVFFYTRHNNPQGKPLAGHSTAFPVKNGKVIYASTSRSGMRRDYTLLEFRKTITSLIKKQDEGK